MQRISTLFSAVAATVTLGLAATTVGVQGAAAQGGADNRGTFASDRQSAPASRARKTVYFTFDDGPNPVHTPALLRLMRSYGARGTFFLVGQRATENPAVAASIRTSGHAVGNHTYTHPRITDITSTQLSEEIRSTDAVIGGSRCFRPPYGASDESSRAVVAAEGKSLEMWTIDTADWSAPGVTAIVDTVRSQVQDGSVVLMHDGPSSAPDQTLAAMEILLPELTRKGYRFESLPTCR